MLIKRSLSKKRRFGVLSSHEDDKPTLSYFDLYLLMLMYITSHSNRLLFYHLNTFMIVKQKFKIKVISTVNLKNLIFYEIKNFPCACFSNQD